MGTGTTVSPLRVEVGDVPAFPVLAALPGNGPVPFAITVALFAVPVAAGVVAGRLLLRRANPPSGLPRAGADGLLAGLGAGLLVLVATALSGGGTGPGRLAVTGPPSWQAGALAAGEVAVRGDGGGPDRDEVAPAALSWRPRRHARSRYARRQRQWPGALVRVAGGGPRWASQGRHGCYDR